ncbi:MAG: hypothetical protein KJN77_00050, partial [Gammaproteobacteria bacterium]|nr:hypothetical protein [Gammaproteobacteria bacterium]
NSLIVLPAGALTGALAIPSGGVQDLLVSWLLSAALIPIFLFGRARLGRTSGAMLVAAYVVYAVVRVLGY